MILREFGGRFSFMEMEKINENTMRVTLGKEDLAERGISILDLIGNQHDVEEFFYSILDEVDTDHEFRDTGAVTFQLVPSGDGVELFITKVDPEAAEKMNLPKDAEFDENNSVMLSNLTPDELDQIGLDKDVTRILKNRMKGNFKSDSEKQRKTSIQRSEKSIGDQEVSQQREQPESYVRVIAFETFQDFIDLTRNVIFKVSFGSDLFRMGDKYYLVVKFSDEEVTSGTVQDVYATMLEYGEAPKLPPIYLEEHGQAIKTRNAYEWFSYNFS